MINSKSQSTSKKARAVRAWELLLKLKDEELNRDRQLLQTVATLILTWLRQLSDLCRRILSCQLTPSTTD